MLIWQFFGEQLALIFDWMITINKCSSASTLKQQDLFPLPTLLVFTLALSSRETKDWKTETTGSSVFRLDLYNIITYPGTILPWANPASCPCLFKTDTPAGIFAAITWRPGGYYSTKWRLYRKVQSLPLSCTIFDRRGAASIYLAQKMVPHSYTFSQILHTFSKLFICVTFNNIRREISRLRGLGGACFEKPF